VVCVFPCIANKDAELLLMLYVLGNDPWSLRFLAPVNGAGPVERRASPVIE
jgi:hypothetical protein